MSVHSKISSLTDQSFITVLMNLKVVIQANNEEKEDEKKVNTKSLGKKIGRNEPCSCGSGKKYKACCGKLV